MADKKDYQGQKPAWCPGCGNFGLLNTLQQTLADLDIPPHQYTIVSGIGQAAKLPHYIRCNAFNGLHGRALPVASGIALANHEMLVMVTTGDGDCYGEGGNHFVHAIRRNLNIKLFVHDNQIYGLTKGQASPTSMEGMETKTQPFGSLSAQLNPLSLAIALDCSFVARGYVGDMKFLQHLMTEAIRHPGFALIDILQPCVTFNKINTFQWYGERVRHLDESHDPGDRMQAFEKSLEWGETIPTGIFYRHARPLFTDKIPPLRQAPLTRQPFAQEKTLDLINEFF
ncbi:MAG: 2-oxoacid:ferredoxin oxidoreductase subunit beta [Desulfobulbaceae bacterium]|jgi:2-oxoglutarate ferredoxin oxidoreductase subunit beta|nr:2-oxoacid:ferredoxin oxidoreductase subunit beta [Desulfobulbaceae bacterium]MDY0352113.1 2-oxoacid:ferredoxin oxidoreductase subunit beta [Desulfobulbaceae bacterium]